MPLLSHIQRRPGHKALYKIEALAPARGGRQVKIEALVSASGMVDLGPEPKIRRNHSNFPLHFKVGPRCIPTANDERPISGTAWPDIAASTVFEV